MVTFKDYPPRMKPGSFTLGDAVEKIQSQAGGSH